MKCSGRDYIMTDLQQSLALSARSTGWSLQRRLDSMTYRGSSSFLVCTFEGVWPWTYTAGWSVLTVICMTVLKGSTALDGFCQAVLWMCVTIQAEIQQVNAAHILLCREEWRASSVLSLVHFWVLICFSECHGLTPASNWGPHSHLLTPLWWDEKEKLKSKSEKTQGLR